MRRSHTRREIDMRRREEELKKINANLYFLFADLMFLNE